MRKLHTTIVAIMLLFSLLMLLVGCKEQHEDPTIRQLEEYEQPSEREREPLFPEQGPVEPEEQDR